jgi:hypothetical protein
MRDALRRIYDAYRTDVAEARHLVGVKLGLKVDVDTCAARATACPAWSSSSSATAPAPPSSSASGPTTPGAREARVQKNSSSKCPYFGRAPLRPAHAALRHAAARPDIGRAAPATCARCAPPASRSACIAGTTCAGRTASRAEADWTEREMRRARERFSTIFRQEPQPGAPPAGRPTATRLGRGADCDLRVGYPRAAALPPLWDGSPSAARSCRPRCRRWTS